MSVRLRRALIVALVVVAPALLVVAFDRWSPRPARGSFWDSRPHRVLAPLRPGCPCADG